MQNDKVTNQYALGVFPSDKFPQMQNFPSCFIANLDNSKQPGSHWVAIFVSDDGVGEYFDSYGRAPSFKFANYLQKYCKTIKHNTLRIQGPFSNSCGQYSVYYLCQRVRGREMKSIIDDFSLDFMLNDVCVAEYLGRNFNVPSQAYDIEFIVEQICKSE